MASMCRKIMSIAVLLNLLHYFYHGIQFAKTHNFATAKHLKYKVQHEICRLRGDYTLLLSNFVLDITFKGIH